MLSITIQEGNGGKLGLPPDLFPYQLRFNLDSIQVQVWSIEWKWTVLGQGVNRCCSLNRKVVGAYFFCVMPLGRQ